LSAADSLNRTAKLLMDLGVARTKDEAYAILGQYVLQIDVASGIHLSRTRQTILLTAINASSRAFDGGVHVRISDDPELTIGWAKGVSLTAAVKHFGGEVVEKLDERFPTIVIGPSDTPSHGVIRLYPTWEGWSAGTVADPSARLSEKQEFELAGVLAAGLSVSEAFQFQLGDISAGRRDVGISLWRPDVNWRDTAATGPACKYLPASAWLLGLGHLGQAYCWALGCLPYVDPTQMAMTLQDFDFVVEANESTSLLADSRCIGERKTRVVSGRLKDVGFGTALVERAFDDHCRRQHGEPMLALAGFDKPGPRRHLDPELRDFNLVVDGGIGTGPQHYLDILVHSFPGSLTTTDAFPDSVSDAEPDITQPAYQHLAQELMQQGASEGEARCGVLEIAGRSVAAAFVGVVTAALVSTLLSSRASFRCCPSSQRSLNARHASPSYFGRRSSRSGTPSSSASSDSIGSTNSLSATTR
jgi:hypothetical protein